MENKPTKRRRRRRIDPADILIPAAGAATVGFQLSQSSGTPTPVEWSLIAGAAVLAVLGVTLIVLKSRTERIEAAARFRDVAAKAMASVERTLPPPLPSLEDEIAEVSATLSKTVKRLRDISTKAEAFEDEVRELVERAEAARTIAELNEDQASKISLLLSERTERSMKAEIEKLKTAHAEQAEQQRRSGTRIALATFAGGVVLGVVGNVVTNLVML
ncbi:hypothetical protein ACQPZK_28120 [Micromonospora sp. CA-249363]|uniref:hypothetical protein n=1 Tax=Micromonospora sp. CA-249363 TaxID=3239963 RepID=UPI003D8B665D